eukprot:PhF_6_TR36333/c0_g1_i15/m.53210
MTSVWILMVLDAASSMITHSLTRDLLLRKSASLMIAVVLPFGLINAHIEDKISDGTVSFLLQVCGVANSLNSLVVVPTRPMDQYAIFLMVCVTMVNLKHWYFQLISIVPGLFIMSYNCSFGVNGYPMLTIVTPESGDVVVEAFVHARLLVMIPLATCLIRSHGRGYYNLTASLECSVRMTKEVSEHLVEYNTRGAEMTLKQYRETTDCDKDLCNVLLVIVENLKKYKPHLPNYVVSSEDQEQEDVNDDLESSGDDTTNTPSTLPPRLSEDSQNSPIVKSSHEALQPCLGVALTTPNRRISSLKLLATIPEHRDISYGLVDFRYKNEGIIDNPIPLRVFIDRVYRAANATQAAIHTCVGDTIHVTWNGASRVTNPRFGAVTFVRMVMNAVYVKKPVLSTALYTVQPMSNRVDVCSSIMSGTAECRMTGTVHHTFLLHRKWGESHQEHFQYARSVRTHVVCGETVKVVRDPVMLVDILDNNVTHRICVDGHRDIFELTTSQTVRTYGSIVKLSLAAYEGGNVQEALHMLDSVTKEFSSEDELPSSIQHLRKKFLK